MPISQQVVQHWILDTASEVVRKLSNFVPIVRGEVLNVLEVPGADPEDYATGVLELFDSGLIRLFSEWEDRDRGIASDRTTIVSILNQRLQLPQTPNTFLSKRGEPRPPRTASVAGPNLYLELTERGGQEWERLAEPDWNRYFQSLTDPSSGEAWSPNRDFLLANLGWLRESEGVVIDRKTMQLEVLRDHPIPYWKRLPVVYHATFACAWVESYWQGDNDCLDEPVWFREWWRTHADWRKKPWELADWPGPPREVRH